MPLICLGKVIFGQRLNIFFINLQENEIFFIKVKVRSITIDLIKDSLGIPYYVVKIEFLDGLINSYNKELPYLSMTQVKMYIVTKVFFT